MFKGKQTRTIFNGSGNRAKELLELIHRDVMGPLPTKSFSVAMFLFTFIDDFSRKVFAVPIKHKSDVFTKFVKFKKFVENQCSKSIKTVRSDNGTEYINTNCMRKSKSPEEIWFSSVSSIETAMTMQDYIKTMVMTKTSKLIKSSKCRFKHRR